MKKIVIFIVFLVLAITSSAQTIHWLTFIDTTDPNVGKIDEYGRDMLYTDFINEIEGALAEIGYQSDRQDYYRYAVTPENCKLAVNMLKISNPDDIIVFYYIGHGGRPYTDSDYIKKHPYPQMCLAQDDQNKYIPLEWVDSVLSKKGARLSVTLGMCCNSMSDGISIKDAPNFASDYSPTYMSSNKRKRIQELFLNTKGNVLATSASPGQVSSTFQIAPDNPLFPNPANYRDRYTYAICLFFQRELDKYNQTLDWDSFLSRISKFVDHYSNGQQTPIHRVNIAKAKSIEPPEPIPPTSEKIKKTKHKQSQVSNSPSKERSIDVVMNENSWKNDLTNYLTVLINPKLADESRQKLEHELSTILFADNAKIRFLGKNSETVIDRADASDWLGYLATNPDGRILKVIVEEGTLDSNKKIKDLKVREIFKK